MLIGIDVAKAELGIAVRPGGYRWTVPNDERSVRPLVERFTTERPEPIVFGTTGATSRSWCQPRRCSSAAAYVSRPAVRGAPRAMDG